MLKHHLVLSARSARRWPVSTVVSVLALAIGLACLLTAYSFVAFLDNAERHFPTAARTFVLTQSFTFVNGTFARNHLTMTPEGAAGALESYFPDVNATRAIPLEGGLSFASGGTAARFTAVAVDADFLDVFPLPFAAGNAASALRAPRSAVLTREAAGRLFGQADPLGKPLVIANGIEATVTGVLDAVPEPSHLGRSESAPLRFDALVSSDVHDEVRRALFGQQGAEMQARSWGGGVAITYLVLPATARVRDVEAQFPDFVERRVPEAERAQMKITFGLLPVRDFLRSSIDDELFSGDFGVSVSSLLLALGALVLGVACVNYANLATARAAMRAHEVGVRKALGAAPHQIAAQHLLESALLTGVAMLTAFAVFRAALPILEKASGLRVGDVLTDGPRIYVFIAAIFTLATLAAGAYPALVLARLDANDALHASLARVGARRLGAWLVGVQFAAASLLVIAVAVVSLQNAKLVRTGLGAVTDPLVLIQNQTSVTKVDSRTLRAELERLPGVKGVTDAANMPWTRLVPITFLSASLEAAAERKRVLVRTVGRDFFRVLDIDLLAGRALDEDLGDADAQGPLASTSRRVVVDRALVEQFGLGSPAEAVGRLLYAPALAGPNAAKPSEIVGVVDNRRFTFRGGGAEGVMYGLGRDLGVTYVRVAAGDVGGALAGIDSAWKRLAPNVAIDRRFFDETFNQAYETFARLNRVFGAMSLMALAISTAGLVGIATLVVGRRRREIGVRKTFGATAAQMTWMLLAAFSRPVVVANLLVWPLAYLAARAYLRAFIDPIALGPAPFLLALAATLGIAWLAVGAQTVRAARLNPADVLHHD
jgi:putative ABC transport system permease protein